MTEGDAQVFRSPRTKNLAGYVKVRFRITVFISVLFVKPIRLRPRFRKGAVSTRIWVDICLYAFRNRHPPTESFDDGAVSNHKLVDYFPYFKGEYKKGGCLPPFNQNRLFRLPFTAFRLLKVYCHVLYAFCGLQ